MHTYILRRMLLMFPTLLGITLVVFGVMASSPGGISAQSLVDGSNLDAQTRQALEDYYNQRYGLNQPAPVQYLRWLNNLSPIGFTVDKSGTIDGFSFTKGIDLGISFRYGRPVIDLIAERVPITLLLNALTLPLVYIIAIVIGVRAAQQRGQRFDVGSGIVMLGLWSAPTMLVGVLAIGFLANQQYWHWFPTSGLSEREALDMAFLPYWQHTTEALLVLSGIVISTLGTVALSQTLRRQTRILIFGVVGMGTGVWMSAGLPGELSILATLILGTSGGALMGAIAAMDYALLRTAFLSVFGGVLGTAITVAVIEPDMTRGFLLDRLWHLVLPVICLSYGGFAFLAKLTRSAVLENLMADFARTARAKGAPEHIVLWRHVFRNSLLPLITVSAALLPGLLAGSVIVESIFSIEGMGKLAVEAVQTRDRELVLSITFVSGLLTLLSYLIADLCYAFADPRVSYE